MYPQGCIARKASSHERFIRRPVEARAGSSIRVNGRWLLNFASTDYLGISTVPEVKQAIANTAHSWGSSLSMPRELADDSLTVQLETALARLTAQDRALIFPSTTHIALDVLPSLTGHSGKLFIDEGAYPISFQGAQAAQHRGARLCRFGHHDPHALHRALRSSSSFPNKVIVCDGVYGAESRVAPLTEFYDLARTFMATLYIDDAHGIGILGRNPGTERPYGRGGGGTARFAGLPPGKLVYVASLGKAFGLPLAFVAGPAHFVDALWVNASTFSHSSPPALPLVAGALAALKVNEIHGETLRRRLLARVARFHNNLQTAGILLASQSYLPVQTVYFTTPNAAVNVWQNMRRAGFLAVLQNDPANRSAGAAVQFVITASHSKTDIDRATSAMIRFIGSTLCKIKPLR